MWEEEEEEAGWGGGGLIKPDLCHGAFVAAGEAGGQG